MKLVVISILASPKNSRIWNPLLTHIISYTYRCFQPKLDRLFLLDSFSFEL